ncbi:MAG: hypothetical protein ACT4PQ_01470 [Betaproteobacteria bacterium]
MFDSQEIDINSAAGGKHMGQYRRLIRMSACIVAAFAVAAPAFASGVFARPGQALNADAARAAIAQADRALRRAQVQHMLWTTAEEALRGARRAFEDGDLATALAQAKVAKEHAELAIAQKRYPPFRL